LKHRKAGNIDSISQIMNNVLYALALALDVLGIIFFYMELKFFGKNTAIALLFIAVLFIATAGLNSIDRD
jgi:hypothetical protein